MTLPQKNERSYLQLATNKRELVLAGEKKHIDELEPLYHQLGIDCRRTADGPDGQECLHFPADADRAKVQEILDSYVTVKGS